MSVTQLKLPPHSIQAEQSVLGIILGNPELLHLADIAREDFYRNDHRAIYDAMVSADSDGQSADLIVVAETLGDQLGEVGGAPYLSELIQSAGASKNLNSYTEIVRDRATLRNGITIGHEISQAGFEGDANAMTSIIADSLNKLSGKTKDLWSPLQSVQETLERIDRVQRGEAPGLRFGVRSLDAQWRTGMKAGQLIVIGGRPAMGKTAVAVNIAEAQSCPVGFISLEMPHDELTQRYLSITSQVPYGSIDEAKMSEAEWKRFTDAASNYSKSGMHIYDLGGATIGQVSQAAMKMRHQHKIGLLIIDYAQLINGDKKQNRNDEIGEITRQLKSLAKRLRIPVILLSQLNRKLEERQNKRPMMSDLRESGQIEQDADMIIFLYRDAIYNEVPDDSIEFLVEKMRNGPIGFAKSGWDGKLMMLRDNH